MLTRERIQQMRDGFASMSGNERDECLYDLALAHIDSERARRVGEAVIKACGILYNAESLVILDKAVAEYKEKKMIFAAHVLDAVTAALREEAK